MKKIKLIPRTLFVLWFCTAAISACKKSKEIELPEDTIAKTIKPVTKLKAVPTSEENEIELSWTNPADDALMKVEITYAPNTGGIKSTPNPIVVDASAGAEMKLSIMVPAVAKYTITVIAINKAGYRSEQSIAQATPYSAVAQDLTPVFLKRADTLMTALVKLYLDGKARDIWSSNYPHTDGYWDGAAVIWGHGGAFSGYAALKEAAEAYPAYKTKIANAYDTRLLTGIDQFRNTKNNKAEAYAVYPGDGDERFYDDNIWVGIDMVDLYML